MLVTCPHCQKDHEINIASELGKRGKGVAKTPSEKATAARLANLAKIKGRREGKI